MKKRIIIFLIFVVLIIAGCIFLMKKNEEFRQEKENQNTEQTDDSQPHFIQRDPVDESELNKNKEKFEEQIQNSESVILYFYADWCPMCQKTTPIIDDIIEKYPDITIIKIDTEIEKDLKNQFDIHNIPTLISIEKNIEIDRIIDELDADKIEEFITK